MHVKTGDKVVVLSGKDKGKEGKVLAVNPDKRTVIVEGVSVATKHKKPRRMGEAGGIINQETPIYASKVMNICAKCKAATRVGRKVLEDGTHVRYCKKCGETFAE
ncbi:MAG: 50S ribosomal protein L24 [Clostridia bacterium]|nr:50S ribosomal protein L24 [Clostridia bacterium]